MTCEISEEEIEELMAEQQHVADSLGMIDFSHYLAFKFRAVMGMTTFGCDFMKRLGKALKYADTNDAVKIIRMWQSEISQYEMLYKISLAKEKAIKELEKEGVAINNA